MKSFLRLAVSFFLLCLVIFVFGFFFGPASIRNAFRDPSTPVGQLKTTDTLVSPGTQDPNATDATTTSPNAENGTVSGTTGAGTSSTQPMPGASPEPVPER
jgi:hypothetical protein